MTARTFVLSAAVVLAVSLLSACGPSSDDPDDAPSSAASEAASSSSSPSASEASEASGASAEKTPGADGEYVEASADGPAQNVPKPQKPALADEESYEGAQAFLDYLADTRAYAWQTGDTSLIREITDEVCDKCYEEYDEIDELYEINGWASSGQEEIEIVDKDMPVNSYGFPSPRVDVRYEGMTIWGPGGEIVEKYPPTGSDDDLTYVHMAHMDSGWVYVLASTGPM